MQHFVDIPSTCVGTDGDNSVNQLTPISHRQSVEIGTDISSLISDVSTVYQPMASFAL